MFMYIIIDIMEVYMEPVKAFKFMNGWMVKHKDIDKIEEAIWVNRILTLESLYVFGWAVKAEMAYCLNYEEAVNVLRHVCGDRFIEESCGFAIMKAGAKYLVLDITALCESCRGSFGSDNLYSLYDLLEGKF